MKKWFVFLLLLGFGVYWFWFQEKRYPPGVLVSDPPRLVTIDNPKSWLVQSKSKEFQLTPRAEYSIEARVLSVNKAYGDTLIGPVDLVLGWGPMSDQSVLDHLKIWQDNMRFWYCDPKGGNWPIPAEEVALHAGNTHIIPANPEIEKTIKSTKRGDIIQLKGYLVDVSKKDGFSWNTSVGPSGFGDHSCKIIWVENFTIR